ncbi:PIN domain-containing protein [Flagellimonas oceanensis]|uniref:PIN domain-containing protein n=1 Tax=Flagellimonas oceanensis TaxID=2499163 RepID=UPI003BABF22A
MNKNYVVDTNALISYFHNVFNQGSSISKKGLDIIESGFKNYNVNLIFPTAVFIEIVEKWFINAEIAAKIKYEVFLEIKNQENMEIQPLDREVLENFLKIVDIEENFKFDNHDKQIYAGAITMNCPLITSDTRVIRYNERKKLVTEIIS